MKILVLGGTGFLGPHEIDQMEDRGWSITMFNRGKTKTTMFPDDFATVTRLQGDRDPDKDDGLKAIQAAIEAGDQWDAVIDNSAYFPRHASATAELLKDSTRQYVFISTVSVYADDVTPGQDESAPVGTLEDPTDETFSGQTYGPLKALCEQAVQKVFGERATIIRPGLIVGPGDTTDRFTYWPIRCERGGDILIPSAEFNVQYIDVRDLAAFIMTCIEQGHGGVYNALGPAGPLTFREMVDGCKATVSSPIEFVAVPDSFLAEHKVGIWAGPESLSMWIPSGPESRAHGHHDNRAAIEHGCTFRPLAQTARATIEWFQGLDRGSTDFGQRAGLSPTREAQLIKAWRNQTDHPTPAASAPAERPR
jgi:2'-hydroxyisoflavone reductase